MNEPVLALDPHTVDTLSTIAGESLNSSAAAWQAVAWTIKNRVGKHEWTHLSTPWEVATQENAFDAWMEKNAAFKFAHLYFSGRPKTGLKANLEALLKYCRPIIEGVSTPVNNAGQQLYYSPKTQSILHAKDPEHYKLVPNWNFGHIVQVFPLGLIETDDFKFYKYI